MISKIRADLDFTKKLEVLDPTVQADITNKDFRISSLRRSVGVYLCLFLARQLIAVHVTFFDKKPRALCKRGQHCETLLVIGKLQNLLGSKYIIEENSRDTVHVTKPEKGGRRSDVSL